MLIICWNPEIKRGFDVDGNVYRYDKNGEIELQPVCGVSKNGLYKCWGVNIGHSKSKHYSVHREMWIAFNGPIPSSLEIDHKDNDPSNNKLSNLQLLPHHLNLRKTLKRKAMNGIPCSSKYKNVYYMNKHAGKGKYLCWKTYISINKEQIYLGSYEYAEEAAHAYDREASKHSGFLTNFELGLLPFKEG